MRLLALAHDAFGGSNAKTANAVVHYSSIGWSKDKVVGVIDRSKVGADAGEFFRGGAGIPIRGAVRDALDLGAEGLVVGIAPVGGALPKDWRDDIETALRNGMTVISGLHTPLAKDEGLARIAREHGGTIRDIRHEHPPQRCTDGSGLFVDSLVVLLVGTDCSSGKMTAAIELTMAARKRGLRAEFVATGQTGIMVGAASGAPVDALVSDFVAGAVESLVVQAAGGVVRGGSRGAAAPSPAVVGGSKGASAPSPDIIFVEGQGALTHPAYSGVTASLLHGAFPDVLVLADEPRREFLSMDDQPVKFVKNTPSRERDLNEAHLALTSRARVGAVALMTKGLTQAEYEAERATAEAELGVAAGDVFRGEADRILDGVLAEAARRGLWDDSGFRRGVKPTRAREGLV